MLSCCGTLAKGYKRLKENANSMIVGICVCETITKPDQETELPHRLDLMKIMQSFPRICCYTGMSFTSGVPRE